MKFAIHTPIDKNYKDTFAKFNLHLFEALKPPLTSLVVERFDGCKKGDEVHLIVNGQKWISHITDDFENENELTFVDKGVVTPFPITYWIHHHRILKKGEHACEIVDDIEFKTSFVLFDLLLYFPFKVMFSLRKPIYKKELN